MTSFLLKQGKNWHLLKGKASRNDCPVRKQKTSDHAVSPGFLVLRERDGARRVPPSLPPQGSCYSTLIATMGTWEHRGSVSVSSDCTGNQEN